MALSTVNYQGSVPLVSLNKLPRNKLIAMLYEQWEAEEIIRIKLAEKDKKIAELKEQLIQLQNKIEKEKDEQTIKDINKTANEPSSKKPEWDKDGNPNPQKRRKKKKKGKRKKRTGCGNKEKSNITLDTTHLTSLDWCPGCGNKLDEKEGRVDSGCIVEHIPPPAKKTTVFK